MKDSLVLFYRWSFLYVFHEIVENLQTFSILYVREWLIWKLLSSVKPVVRYILSDWYLGTYNYLKMAVFWDVALV
jgi:hypothetical protein